MGDVKDILGLNRGGPPDAAPQKKEKPKEPQRPKGLSREAFSLLYGQHPIAPSRLLNEVIKKEEPKSAATTQVCTSCVHETCTMHIQRVSGQGPVPIQV
jgi:hypothetical protein